MNTNTYLISEKKIQEFAERQTAEDLIPNPFKTTNTGTPATGIPLEYYSEPTQGNWYGDWGNRDRTEANKGKREKAKIKNRKAAKAARKARKVRK